MKLGKLNDILKNLSLRVTFENNSNEPRPETTGDPLCGEALVYKWNSVCDEGIELYISLGELCFVDRVRLCIGSKTALTSVSLKDASYSVLSVHNAETGKIVSVREIELEAGAVTDRLSLVIRGDFSDIELQNIELYGFVGEKSPLFPTPTKESFGEVILPCDHFVSYSADSKDGMRAGEILAEKFFEKTAHKINKTSEKGDISFTYDSSVASDGYELEISEENTYVKASNLRGFVMGSETFIKLTDRMGVRTAKVSDVPFLPFRGVHLFLPSEEQMDFARRLIKYVISPMGYNCVIIEVATEMQYESHPEINAAVADALEKAKKGIYPPLPHGSVADGMAVPKKVIAEFVDHVRSYGIEVIPEVQSLGHVPYMTLTYPEIAEVDESEKSENIDTRAEDAIPEKFYPHCYCPSNERSYEILFDLLDEVIDVFRPKEYVHMGHDEVYYMGLCPKCKGKSHAELFASDVNRIYAHLKKKGLKMMIWSDMLQPVTKYKTLSAVDMIPKDILCLDFIWYFHLDKDIEDNLLDKGFKVAVGNLYSSHYPRFESRIRKEGMIGGQISTWVSTSEESLVQEGKLYDLYMTAQMLWSESYSRNCRLSYDRMISKLMPSLRENLKKIKYPSLMPNAKSKVLLENTPAFPPTIQADTVCSADVNEAYDSLIITHTMTRRLTRQTWTPCPVVAKYILRYEDETVEEIPVTVGGNIAHWNRRHNQPFTHRLYRHNGYTATYETDGEETKTASGENVTLYRYEHILKSDTRLVSVKLEENTSFNPGVILCRLEGVLKG